MDLSGFLRLYAMLRKEGDAPADQLMAVAFNTEDMADQNANALKATLKFLAAASKAGVKDCDEMIVAIGQHLSADAV